LALVPRLPGDTCVLSVEVGDKKASYADMFRYKVAATATTIAGDGTNAFVLSSLDKLQLEPVYLGMDKDYNIFVTEGHGYLLKMNEAENSVTVLATTAMGFNHRCMPVAHPVTNVLFFGAEGAGNRNRFLTCDPKEGWAPKVRFISSWDLNGFELPANGDEETHYHILYCEEDGYYYTRYNSGHLVKIDPQTWAAKIIGQTPSGVAYGMAFHPIDKTSLWMGYRALSTGTVANSICRVDVTDPEATFEKLSGAINGGHRDGPIENAQFNDIRMINFDAEGNLFVGENLNHCIRMVNTQTMMVETLIGIPGIKGFKDGSKEDALFNGPHGIVVDADGIVYVSDHLNCRVRRIAIE
jgi:sugar lactone lactonase YvrE